MVRLLSSLVLSTLIIAPTFASTLWDLEVRELNEAEAALFARDMQGLFARQRNPEYADLARRDSSRGQNQVPVGSRLHAPLRKHELYDDVNLQPRSFDDDVDLVDRFDDELLERNLDRELYIRDHLFHNDLD